VDFRLGPHERFGIFIVVFDEGIDVLLDLVDRSKRRAVQRLALQDREPALDLIEPRGACRRKVECHERVTLEPFVVLLVCIQIVEDDLQTGLWIVRDDFPRIGKDVEGGQGRGKGTPPRVARSPVAGTEAPIRPSTPEEPSNCTVATGSTNPEPGSAVGCGKTGSDLGQPSADSQKFEFRLCGRHKSHEW
jgi:hypothetical protein